MAKRLVISSKKDPAVSVIFTEVEEGTPGKPRGWYGECTECGPAWASHRWSEKGAETTGNRHIDMHDRG